MSTHPARHVALSLSLLAVLATTTAPARADELSTAQASVDALQAEVASVAVRLTTGTQRLAADQAERTQVVRLLASNVRKVAGAQARADSSAALVATIAGQLYRSPPPGLLLLSLSSTPRDIAAVLSVQAGLTQLADRQDGQVRRAIAQRVALQGRQQQIRQLAEQAELLAARSAAQRDELVGLARATAGRLEAAQTALGVARRAQAARLAAQRAADARWRAGSAPPADTGQSAGCSASSTAGQANGNLDPGSLCPVWGAPGERLRGDAARAYNAMSRHKAATTGSALCVIDAYRPYREQVIVYAQTPAMTAIPGTSNHGWGRAVDLCGGAERYDGAAYLWLKANAGRFGWHHPAWAEPGQRQEEPWHWEFAG